MSKTSSIKNQIRQIRPLIESLDPEAIALGKTLLFNNPKISKYLRNNGRIKQFLRSYHVNSLVKSSIDIHKFRATVISSNSFRRPFCLIIQEDAFINVLKAYLNFITQYEK